jgi:hypothetical protein
VKNRRVHETRSAEKLALAWHAFGVVASLWWTFAAISGMQSYWPFISAPDPYGAIAKQLCYSAMLNALVAAAGALWHIWATLEHKKKL